MKKLLSIVLILLLALTILAGCTNQTEQKPDSQKPDDTNQNPSNTKPADYTFVAPDGAPALAISQLLAENMQFENNFTYNVVPADQIKNSFVGNGNHADFGLLPVNLASLLLGSGDEYKMVGVVTHGNLYLLSKTDSQITADNATQALKGKSIAVVNLAAVPGLTTKAMLTKLGVEYTEDESKHTSQNVYLKGINGTEIAPSLNAQQNAVDFVVAPEPAVSTITGQVPSIKKVGALHEIYGRYPQAVLVVKTQIVQTNLPLVKQVFEVIKGAPEYVKSNTSKAVDAVASHLPQGATPSFKAQNTTATVIDGCGIDLQMMNQQTVTEVKTYIQAIIQVKQGSAKEIPETFFVNIEKIK